MPTMRDSDKFDFSIYLKSSVQSYVVVRHPQIFRGRLELFVDVFSWVTGETMPPQN